MTTPTIPKSTADVTVREKYLARLGKYINADQIAATTKARDEQIEAIRRSKSLSDQGKRIEMAKSHVQAKRVLEQLKAQLQAGVDADRSRMERSLFGPGTVDPHERLAHRDAFDRATAITDEAAALQMLRRAEFSGDTGQARAIAYVAHQQHWGFALSQYEHSNPGTLEKLDILEQLPDGETLKNLMFKMTPPDELRADGENGIEQLAASE